MHRKSGFTLLEIIIVACFASLLLILFFVQKNNVDAMDRDSDRKTAINAMYYALEEAYYPANNYYPAEISEENLKSIDPAMFTDPSGINLGDEGSSYTYEASDCDESGHCKHYILTATLEKEALYSKHSRN